jgi:hypothetical protein
MGAFDALINAPRQQKLIFGAMLLVAGAALAYFFLISGARAERDTLLEENEVRRAEVLKAKADEANLRPFRAQAEALRKKLGTARSGCPRARDPGVYRGVRPRLSIGPQRFLFQPKPARNRRAVSADRGHGQCTYHQLKPSCARGQMPRIVSLGEFRHIGIDRPTGAPRRVDAGDLYVQAGRRAPPAGPGAL